MTSTSIWMRDAGLPAWPALAGDRRERVVVVGAGLAGLGLARALRARGVDPLIVDARGPAAGASGRNAGFVLRTHVTELPALLARVGRPLVTELLALAAENHARVRALAGIDDPTRYRARGSLMLATGEVERARLVEASSALREAGVRASDVAVPAGLAAFDAALRVDDDGEVHPGRLVAALAEGARGARMDVRAVDAAGVSDGAHRIEADHVVLATNAWLGAVVPALAPVVTPNRAQMLATAPLAPTLELPCYAGLGFDYFRQRPDGRVLLGGRRHLFVEAERTRDESTSSEVQAALEAYLAEHLPFARGARIEERWSGIMAFTPDGLPLAGRTPVAGGSVWVLGGWTGHGLGLSLAVANRLAAKMIDRDRTDALLDALAPTRFA
ncbi:MAG: FAD-dependent oxidoreductase [Sandaracinus sp.]